MRRLSRGAAPGVREPRGRAADDTPLRSFRKLLADLASVTRNVCRAAGAEGTRQTEFELDTQLSADQARALEHLKAIQV